MLNSKDLIKKLYSRIDFNLDQLKNNQYQFSDPKIGPYVVAPSNLSVINDKSIILYFLYHDSFITFDFSAKEDSTFISESELKSQCEKD